MESNTTLQKPNRLLSLDILRGADLAMLVLVQPILLKALETMQPAEGTVGHFIMGQLLHLPWEGFCFWDIIMPLFMFMSGITIPFAMARYKRGERIDGSFYRRILKRFVVRISRELISFATISKGLFRKNKHLLALPFMGKHKTFQHVI